MFENMPKEVKAAYIAAAGAILAALIAALFGLFSGDKPSTTNVHQTNSGDNSPQFGMVNGPVKVAYQGDTNNYGISLEAHKRALEEREREVKERFSKTDPSDRIVRQVLEKEYNDIVVKLSNLEASFREEIAARSEIEKTLQELKENLPASQANKAIQKFKEGDKEAAKQLFDSVIKQAEESEELAGQAAFENGRMAEQEIRYLEAKDYYQKAVRFQPENSKYNNALGLMLHNLGDPNQAIAYYQQALASDLKTYGEDHPDVAIRRNNLGSAYKSLGRYDQAIAYYQQALDSLLKTYGEDHPQVATYRNNLGSAYHSLGQYNKAIAYYQQALASDLKTYGEDHPQVATYRNNLGGAYESLGQYDKALAYYQQALDSLLKTYGEDHPSTQTVRSNLQAALGAMNSEMENEG